MKATIVTTVSVLGMAFATQARAAEPPTLQIEVSGDATLKATVVEPESLLAPSDIIIGTDYWKTPAEAREMITKLNASDSKHPTPAETKRIDELMKQEPHLNVLLVRASNKDFSVGLTTDPSQTKYKDVPFKPGRYPIRPGGGLGARPGEFTATFKVKQAGQWLAFKLDKPGEIALTQFDKNGLKGTFSFTAIEVKGTRTVSVKGSFSSPCHPSRGDACKI